MSNRINNYPVSLYSFYLIYVCVRAYKLNANIFVRWKPHVHWMCWMAHCIWLQHFWGSCRVFSSLHILLFLSLSLLLSSDALSLYGPVQMGLCFPHNERNYNFRNIAHKHGISTIKLIAFYVQVLHLGNLAFASWVLSCMQFSISIFCVFRPSLGSFSLILVCPPISIRMRYICWQWNVIFFFAECPLEHIEIEFQWAAQHRIIQSFIEYTDLVCLQHDQMEFTDPISHFSSIFCV